MPTTAAELRAEIARLQVRKYKLAGMVGIRPSLLGPMLNGRIPLPPEVAERVEHALERMKHGSADDGRGGGDGHGF